MVTRAASTLRLRAVTRPLAELPEVVRLADPSNPLLWTRGDRGCVGLGETLRLEFSGPDRFTRAEDEWRSIAEAAEIEDPVRLPGTGLVALGAFAFADDSEATSVLIVPRLLIARHRGSAWVTEISRIDDAEQTGAELGSERVGGGLGAARADAERADASAGDPSAEDRTNGPSTTPVGPHAGLDSPAPLGHWPGTELHEVADPAAYLDGVAEAERRIEARRLEKIVLSRQLSGELDATADLRVPLSRLAERYVDCWTFAVDGLIGSSPETLIRSTGGAVSIRVLAGTRARHPENPIADARASHELLTSAKEQHEHAFAVQSVVTALAPYVRDLQSSEEAFALELPNVWHLATDLGALIGDDGGRRPWGRSLSLVARLHPTAAVAGTPTAAAVEAIAELEPFDRGRYAGAVGWIDANGDGEWVIALRCAQLSSPSATGTPAAGSRPTGAVGSRTTRTVTATAGGGIVAGSVAAHELSETESKFRPILEAFAE